MRVKKKKNRGYDVNSQIKDQHVSSLFHNSLYKMQSISPELINTGNEVRNVFVIHGLNSAG